MTFDRIACVHSGSPLAEQSYKALSERYSFTSMDKADVILVLGGDGFMLQCYHEYQQRGVPIYGMNRGTIGFLMNEYCEVGFLEKLNSAESTELYPLHMTTKTVAGDVKEALAFNEVSLVRYSQQAANIRIVIDEQERLPKLISDGIMVATPAGTTAYNMSVNGPIIPIGSNVLALTPISPFRPRQWRGALLPRSANVEFEILDCNKRPVSASADSTEVKNVASVLVREDRSKSITVLFDSGHSLEERIINEQFNR
jgi:NAD+ kinase